MDQLGKLSHKSFIALHAPGRVNQHDIVVLVLGVKQGLFGDHGRIVLVALLIEWHVEAGSVSRQLFDGARPEIVTAGKHHLQIALRLQIVGSLGQRGRLTHAVDTNEGNAVDATLLLGGESLLENVNVAPRRE